MKKQTVVLRDEILRDRLIKLLSTLNLETPWEVTWVPYSSPHTTSQRGLMWLWIENVVGHVHEATGQDKEDVHEFLKQKFLAPKIIEINGEIVKRWSTKGLSTADMSSYMDAINAWATYDMGLRLPAPEDKET